MTMIVQYKTLLRLVSISFAVVRKGELMSRLIYLNLGLLIIYAIIIRRQLDRVEKKINAMLVERKTNETD